MNEAIDTIRMDMEDLVEHREELTEIAKFDKELAVRLELVFDQAEDVIDYITQRGE